MVVRFFILSLLFCVSRLANGDTFIESDIGYYKNNKVMSSEKIQLWQRQLLSVNLRVTTSEEFSFLTVEKLNNPSFVMEHYTDGKTHNNDKGFFVKNITLYIWPVKTGNLVLNLPEINLMSGGRSIRTFQIPEKLITVSTLPEYLPPGFPVGKVSFSSDYEVNSFFPFFVTPGKLARFTLTAHTSGIHNAFIPTYSNYLESEDITQLKSDTTLSVVKNDKVFSLEKEFSSPIVIDSSGLYRFKPIKVLSFDPEKEKVISFYYQPDTLFTLNIAAQFILLIILLVLLHQILNRILRAIKNIIIRRQIWKNIILSEDILALSTALRSLPPYFNLFDTNTFKMRQNTGLERWAEQWDSDELSSSVSQLNKLIFSESSGEDFDNTKNQLIVNLKKYEHFIFYCFNT